MYVLLRSRAKLSDSYWYIRAAERLKKLGNVKRVLKLHRMIAPPNSSQMRPKKKAVTGLIPSISYNSAPVARYAKHRIA